MLLWLGIFIVKIISIICLNCSLVNEGSRWLSIKRLLIIIDLSLWIVLTTQNAIAVPVPMIYLTYDSDAAVKQEILSKKN